VSAPPGGTRSQIYEEIFCWAGKSWKVGVDNLAVVACVLKTTTKKKVVNFFRKKCTPEKILATPMLNYAGGLKSKTKAPCKLYAYARHHPSPMVTPENS